MKELKLDHIIHYIQQLNDFKYPGHILKLNQGGQQHLIIQYKYYSSKLIC